ncbi:MAG: hypothetical protein JXQ91_07625 [Vannielia sp.]|uniref:hypothetical protein n=1 Tax=Vannielia sp. TaxID=2813045 RepID=UPI003B8DCF97
MNDLFPETIDRTQHGATWWASDNWQGRNFHGFYQCREGGKGEWQFVIYAFCNDDVSASVYVVADRDGDLQLENVPIDQKDRLHINGKTYGRRNWCH